MMLQQSSRKRERKIKDPTISSSEMGMKKKQGRATVHAFHIKNNYIHFFLSPIHFIQYNALQVRQICLMYPKIAGHFITSLKTAKAKD